MTPRLRHLGAALLLASSLGLAAPAQAASDGASARSARVGATNAYSRAAFTHTNRARSRHDVRTLRGNACLRKAALRQARKIARDQSLSHQDMYRVMDDCGLRSAGENVAYGYPTGRAVVDGWMGSPGHRANILSSGFRLMGLAAVKDSDGTWWAAQVFGSR